MLGDEALKTIAILLTKSVRTTDVVARFGGEEFAIILPDTKESDAIHLAERCRITIEKYDWAFQPVTVSVGVSSKVFLETDDVDDSDQDSLRTQIYSEADQALYLAKDKRRNCVVHFSEKLNNQ